MKKMWRHRLTAWILSSVMAVSAIPVTVQAEPAEDGYTEEVTVQETESEVSEAEGENALEESEQPKAGGQDEDEGTPENGAEIEYVETEIENAYQFGDAPTEREPAVYARARSNDAGIEDYLYQQIQARVEDFHWFR